MFTMSININLKKLHIKSLKGFSLLGPSRTPEAGEKALRPEEGKKPQKQEI